MDVDSGLVAEESEVVFEFFKILSAADEFADIVIEGLDADFELQRSGGELTDQFAEGIGESIGDHFEVKEESRRVTIEEELEDRAADVEIEIESSIDEFELPEAA